MKRLKLLFTHACDHRQTSEIKILSLQASLCQLHDLKTFILKFIFCNQEDRKNVSGKLFCMPCMPTIGRRGLHAVHTAEMVVHARDLIENCHTLQTGENLSS